MLQARSFEPGPSLMPPISLFPSPWIRLDPTNTKLPWLVFITRQETPPSVYTPSIFSLPPLLGSGEIAYIRPDSIENWTPGTSNLCSRTTRKREGGDLIYIKPIPTIP